MKGQRCNSVQLAWLPLLIRDLFVTKLSTRSFIYVNTFQGGRASVLHLLLAYWLSVNRQSVSSQHWPIFTVAVVLPIHRSQVTIRPARTDEKASSRCFQVYYYLKAQWGYKPTNNQFTPRCCSLDLLTRPRVDERYLVNPPSDASVTTH